MEKNAFSIAFYLLNIKEKYQETELRLESQKCSIFYKDYGYYKKIKDFELIDYLKIKQSP